MPKFTSESITSLINKVCDADERYVLPSLQRPFVWKERQIFRLFDSIMRRYPLGSLLIWKTKRPILYKEFRKEWNKGATTVSSQGPNEKPKNMVLDGQQRLQSLLIGLCGSHDGRTLYFNAIVDPCRSIEEREDDDGLAYTFKFYKDSNRVQVGYVSVAELCEKFQTEPSFNKIATAILQTKYNGGSKIDSKNRDQIISNLEAFKYAFLTNNSAIAYNLVDEISEPSQFKSDEEIVEIFIRANSGGTKLTKSDLLFSLLSTGWSGAYDEIREIEEELTSEGFDFSKDYILKALLICTDQKAAYQVNKFKQPGALEKAQAGWKNVRQSLIDTVIFLKECTPIQTRKALVSQNSLLPIIAMRSKIGKKKWNNIEKSSIAQYVLITTLAGSFNGAKDTLLDKLSTSMTEGFNLEKVLDILKDDNRNTEFDEKKIWDIKYSQPEKVCFAMSQIIAGLTLSGTSNKHIDHIISRDSLNDIKINGAKVPASQIDQIANLTIIDGSQNQSKGSKPLIDWVREMDAGAKSEYLEKHCIPSDEKLWEPRNFLKFIEARKELILRKTELGSRIQKRDNTNEDNSESGDDDSNGEI